MISRDSDINYLTYKLNKVYFLLDQFLQSHGKDLTDHQRTALTKCYLQDSLSYKEYTMGRHVDSSYREPFAEDPE